MVNKKVKGKFFFFLAFFSVKGYYKKQKQKKIFFCVYVYVYVYVYAYACVGVYIFKCALHSV